MKIKRVDLWYPGIDGDDRTDDQPEAIEIGLVHVRAADTIRVTYDFDRDGYVISMKPTVDKGGWSEEVGDWEERAFVPAWNERPLGEGL